MAALLAVSHLVAIALLMHTSVVPCPSTADTLLQEESVLGPFRQATRLAVNPQGWLYVLDAELQSLLLFKTSQDQPRSVGGLGWSATSFDRPTGITTDGLSVYVSDYYNHRIQRFDRNLNYLASFSTRDTTAESARFGYPMGVALSRLGDLFVIDSENIRVLKFTPQRRLERAFGGIEETRGKLRHPLKILLSPDDHVYVLEPDRLIEYDNFGNFLRIVGQGLLHQAQGFHVGRDALVVATIDSLIWFSRSGRVETIVPVSSILASVPLTPLHDVALSGEKLFLLTARQLVIMKRVVVK